MIDEADNLPAQPDHPADDGVVGPSAASRDPSADPASNPPEAGGQNGNVIDDGDPTGGHRAAEELPSDENLRDEPDAESLQATGRQRAETSADRPEHVEPEDSSEPASEDSAPIYEDSAPDEPEQRKMDWYILKVQSNREDSIREALQRRINIAGLEKSFDEIIVPVEMVSEFKNGKKRVVKRKLYPGYIVVHMELNEDTWFLVRETPGIGDFTGSGGKPSPMLPHEVSRIMAKQEEKTDEAPKLKISFNTGDRVKITEGTFENFEGDVDSIDQANGRVTVMINIFGRSTPVELEYWQIESL
ncbi:MAG: transcription termination/antitermination protein NusG [Pirellulales bacterium]